MPEFSLVIKSLCCNTTRLITIETKWYSIQQSLLVFGWCGYLKEDPYNVRCIPF